MYGKKLTLNEHYYKTIVFSMQIITSCLSLTNSDFVKHLYLYISVRVYIIHNDDPIVVLKTTETLTVHRQIV